MSGRELYDAVITAAGLGLVGPFVVNRMLFRVSVYSPESLTHAKLASALPYLEEAIRLYLRGDAVNQAIARVRALAASDALPSAAG